MHFVLPLSQGLRSIECACLSVHGCLNIGIPVITQFTLPALNRQIFVKFILIQVIAVKILWNELLIFCKIFKIKSLATQELALQIIFECLGYEHFSISNFGLVIEVFLKEE